MNSRFMPFIAADTALSNSPTHQAAQQRLYAAPTLVQRRARCHGSESRRPSSTTLSTCMITPVPSRRRLRHAVYGLVYFVTLLSVLLSLRDFGRAHGDGCGARVRWGAIVTDCARRAQVISMERTRIAPTVRLPADRSRDWPCMATRAV
ncbi:hypothetical protein BDU57DRAFT_32407 [Ampelomyces quisqualis]|uniref:Uncharacterized protein n=1 Tax=Ampelomyces quisqualis TaxID=50730 RepID=A0A6A5R0M7_AMPQU|nr:hypothetical protein BDU57DRAFT_32407 [Ampelomyces quisqualis]